MAVLIAGLFGGYMSSVNGAAQVQTETFTSDFYTNSEPICGGPSVVFDGTVRFVFHETVDENGQVHQDTNVIFFKIKGTDLSGDTYVLTETDHFNVKVDDETSTIHTVINGKLIHNGKETDTGVVVNLRTVFDENGPIKTTVEKIDIKCNGPEE